MSERYVSVRVRTRVRGIKFFELFFLSVMMLGIFTCWARIDLRWNRVWQIVCFSSISHACHTTAGGIHLKFTLVAVGRAYEYSLQWVNAWTHFFLRFLILFLLFVLLCCVSVVLYSQWVLENWFDALVVWLFLIANELGFLSCQYSERFKPIFIT